MHSSCGRLLRLEIIFLFCLFYTEIHTSNASVVLCVCVTMKKKVPDEWQARQATPAILQVSSSKHNAKKITTRERGPFHQSITAILTEEKSVCVCVCVCVFIN